MSRRPSLPSSLRGFGRDEAVLAVAVLVGGGGAALARPLLLEAFAPETSRSAALALATTLTGLTHARLAHRKRLRMLVPTGIVSAPLVYLLMRAIHAVAGT